MGISIDSKIYEQLSRPFDEKGAIQKTNKDDTHKGYDTTGIGYQFCVNRFNEVLGTNGWGYTYEKLREATGSYKTGAPYFDITVEVRIWVGTTENFRSCVGGHISSIYADAFKGAVTNAFKKSAAFWGVGRQAYEGTLDDDAEIPGPVEDMKPEIKPQAPSPKPASKKEEKNPQTPLKNGDLAKAQGALSDKFDELMQKKPALAENAESFHKKAQEKIFHTPPKELEALTVDECRKLWSFYNSILPGKEAPEALDVMNDIIAYISTEKKIGPPPEDKPTMAPKAESQASAPRGDLPPEPQKSPEQSLLPGTLKVLNSKIKNLAKHGIVNSDAFRSALRFHTTGKKDGAVTEADGLVMMKVVNDYFSEQPALVEKAKKIVDAAWNEAKPKGADPTARKTYKLGGR